MTAASGIQRQAAVLAMPTGTHPAKVPVAPGVVAAAVVENGCAAAVQAGAVGQVRRLCAERRHVPLAQLRAVPCQ